MKALAIFVGPLGDFVMSWPSLAAIRAKHGSLELCTEGRFLALSRSLNLADSVTVFGPVNLGTNAAWFEQYQSRFADVYSFLGPQFLPGSPMHRPASGPRGTKPIAQWFLDSFGLTGNPIPKATLSVPKTSPPVVAIHARLDRAPVWPHWASLIAEVTQTHDVAVLTGRGEPPLFKTLPARVAAWRNLPLDALAQKLAAATAFMATDSGPGHLAASLGIPGVSLCEKPAWKIPSPAVTTVPLRASAADILSALPK